MSTMLLIGIGNAFRHDDGVGLWVAQEMRRHALPDLTVLESTGDGAELLDTWEDVETVVLVDAAQSGAASGTLHRLDALAQSLPTNLFPRCSSHLFSVAEAVRMGEILNRLPRCLIIYGIEGSDFSSGVGLAPEVQYTAQELVNRLCLSFP